MYTHRHTCNAQPPISALAEDNNSQFAFPGLFLARAVRWWQKVQPPPNSLPRPCSKEKLGLVNGSFAGRPGDRAAVGGEREWGSGRGPQILLKLLTPPGCFLAEGVLGREAIARESWGQTREEGRRGRASRPWERALGHPESESSWGTTPPAPRAIRPERELSRSKLSWKVEAELCRGGAGRRGEGGQTVPREGAGRRARAGCGGGRGARRSPGSQPSGWGGPAGCRFPPTPGSRGRTGQEAPWRGAPSRC